MNYHIMVDDKFIDAFIEDSENVSSPNTNIYFIRGLKRDALYVKHPKVEWVEDLRSHDFRNILNNITLKDKIFIHWYDLYVGELLLTINKNIPIYVVPWGGDFYADPFLYHINWIFDKITLRYVKKTYILPKKWAKNPFKILKQIWRVINYKKDVQKKFKLKKLTVLRINYLLLDPNNFFEVNLIKKIYGIEKLYCLPFIYNQNFDLANKIRKSTNNEKIIIQIGNSATESNNHVDCLEVLKHFYFKNIKLLLPLSYGTPNYARFVKKYCVKKFINKCEFIDNYMPRDEYIKKLNEVDIGIMFNNRSQAFGNCITLLTLGKKLYLKTNNPLWHLFQGVGITVFDANRIRDLTFEEFSRPLTVVQIQSNIEKISNLFSKKKRLEYLSKLLN